MDEESNTCLQTCRHHPMIPVWGAYSNPKQLNSPRSVMQWMHQKRLLAIAVRGCP